VRTSEVSLDLRGLNRLLSRPRGECRAASPRLRGRWTTVLLSALFFALIHSPLHWAFTFLFGMVTGSYYTRERKLIPLMVAHAIVDLWSFGWFLLLC
jgi:membrane protease YdiL (CAAX protease family)